MTSDFYLRMLLHGPSGRWKTSQAKTCLNDPRFMPMLFLDSDGGTDSIHSACNFITKEKLGKSNLMDKIDVVPIETWADFDSVLHFMNGKEFNYKSIFLDSISELTTLNIFSQTGAMTSAKDSILKVRMATQPEYGKTNEQLNVLVRLIRKVDAHVICVSGSKLDSNPETGEKGWYPALVGQLATQLPHIFSIVGYMKPGPLDNNKQTQMLMMFNSCSEYFAKIRDEHRRVGDGMLNPTLPRLLDKLTGVGV
jgi:hypothetical protein